MDILNLLSASHCHTEIQKEQSKQAWIVFFLCFSPEPFRGTWCIREHPFVPITSSP